MPVFKQQRSVKLPPVRVSFRFRGLAAFCLPVLCSVVGAVCAAGAWAAGASVARADRIVVRGSVDAAQVDAEVFTRVQHSMERALSSSGHTPVVLGAIMEQRDHGIPEALSSCADTDCAPELLKQVPADAMVLVSLWPAVEGRGAATDGPFVLTLTGLDAHGGRVDETLGQAEENTGDSEDEKIDPGVPMEEMLEKIPGLVDKVLHAMDISAGPWLQVNGTPVGAFVYVDGSSRFVGTVPCKVRLAPGDHRIRVAAVDREETTQTITLMDDPSHIEVMEVALVKVGAKAEVDEAAAKPSARGGVPWDYIIGGALIAASVPMVATSVRTGLQHGECISGDCTTPGGLREEAFFGPMAIGVGIAGLLVAGGGAYFLVARPVRGSPVTVQPAVSNTSASIHIKGTF